MCNESLPPDQQYLFNSKPYCHRDFRKLFPISPSDKAAASPLRPQASTRPSKPKGRLSALVFFILWVGAS